MTDTQQCLLKKNAIEFSVKIQNYFLQIDITHQVGRRRKTSRNWEGGRRKLKSHYLSLIVEDDDTNICVGKGWF